MAESTVTPVTEVEVAVDEDERKIFVGGLPQDATQSDIEEHFSTYGEIESVNIKTDQASGRSRGFAFIVYKDVKSLTNAVAAASHTVKNKEVAVKKAQAKQGKVYVGKLQPQLTDEEIREHFEQYGSVANVEQPFDKTKNERKNYCFITFAKEDAAKQLLKLGTTSVNGVDLDIKRVTVKDPLMMGMAVGRGRGGSGYGGGFGGYGYYGAGYGNWDMYNNYGGWGGYGGGFGGYGNPGVGFKAGGYGGGRGGGGASKRGGAPNGDRRGRT